MSGRDLGIVVPKVALISVSNKTGIVDLAMSLDSHGIKIFSTGGTAKVLRDVGLPVTDVEKYTDFPEMMGGRLKTLHPLVHGGLLGRHGIDDDVMQSHGIIPIDMLVVNLYPFEETIKKPGVTLEEANEQIDIGGPAMLRAAAKNHERVAVLSDPTDYPKVLQQLERHGGTTLQMRLNLKAELFLRTAHYDLEIGKFLATYTTEEAD